MPRFRHVGARPETRRPLRRDFELLAGRRREFDQDFKRAAESPRSFTAILGHIEEEALQKSGASPQLTRFLFADVDTLLRSIREQELSADRAQNYVERLRDSVCSSGDSVITLLASKDRRRLAQGMVQRGAQGIAGAGIVSVNAGGDAVTTLGLAPWMTALSGAFGGALIGQAMFGR